MNRFLFPFLTALIFFTSCSSNEVGNSKDVNPETIWFDYKIWGDEESGNMTVKLQYRFAGPNGTTLLLNEPSRTELDAVVIQADSSRRSGAFYEVTHPVKDFAGKHSIVFTDLNKKQYKEEFNFQPINFITNVPAVISRGDLVFQLDGLAPTDYIRVMMTDTAAFSEGITRIDTVENGRITISKKDLESLVNGPIHFEIAKEVDKRVKNGTKEGGRISVSYEVKREFELRDDK